MHETAEPDGLDRRQGVRQPGGVGVGAGRRDARAADQGRHRGAPHRGPRHGQVGSQGAGAGGSSMDPLDLITALLQTVRLSE